MPATKKLRADAQKYVAGVIASKKGGARYSDRRLDKVSVEDLEKLLASDLWQQSATTPVKLPAILPIWDGKKDHWNAYLYQDAYWTNNVAHSNEEMKLLVREASDAAKRKFARLQRKFSEGAELPLS